MSEFNLHKPLMNINYDAEKVKEGVKSKGYGFADSKAKPDGPKYSDVQKAVNNDKAQSQPTKSGRTDNTNNRTIQRENKNELPSNQNNKREVQENHPNKSETLTSNEVENTEEPSLNQVSQGEVFSKITNSELDTGMIFMAGLLDKDGRGEEETSIDLILNNEPTEDLEHKSGTIPIEKKSNNQEVASAGESEKTRLVDFNSGEVISEVEDSNISDSLKSNNEETHLTQESKSQNLSHNVVKSENAGEGVKDKVNMSPELVVVHTEKGKSLDEKSSRIENTEKLQQEVTKENVVKFVQNNSSEQKLVHNNQEKAPQIMDNKISDDGQARGEESKQFSAANGFKDFNQNGEQKLGGGDEASKVVKVPGEKEEVDEEFSKIAKDFKVDGSKRLSNDNRISMDQLKFAKTDKADMKSVDKESLVDQVKVQLSQLGSKGTKKITIQLHPAELGRVQVKIEMPNVGPAKVIFTSDKIETINTLRQDIKQIEENLNKILSSDVNSYFNLKEENQQERQDQGSKTNFANDNGEEEEHLRAEKNYIYAGSVGDLAQSIASGQVDIHV